MTTEGKVLTGMLVRESDAEIVLRDSSNLEKEIAVAKDQIDEREVSKTSMTPDGILSALRTERAFLELVSYVTEVASGGTFRAAELKPISEQLIVQDDTKNLNHAGI